MLCSFSPFFFLAGLAAVPGGRAGRLGVEAPHEEAGEQRARAVGPGGRAKRRCPCERRLGAGMPSWLSTGHQTRRVFLCKAVLTDPRLRSRVQGREASRIFPRDAASHGSADGLWLRTTAGINPGARSLVQPLRGSGAWEIPVDLQVMNWKLYFNKQTERAFLPRYTTLDGSENKIPVPK